MTFSLENVVRRHFSFLLDDKGFRLGDINRKSDFDFGVHVDMSSDDFRLRIGGERTREGIVLVSPTFEENWYALPIVQQLLTGKAPAWPGTVGDDAEFIRSHYAQLRELFQLENYRAALSALDKLIEVERAE